MNDLSCTTCLNYTTVSNMYLTHPCLECAHMSEYQDSLDKAMEVPLDVDPGRKVNTTLKEDKGFNRKECVQLSTPWCYGTFTNQTVEHCNECNTWEKCAIVQQRMRGKY